MPRPLFAVVVAVALLGTMGCSKPSPAQVALSAFAEQSARKAPVSEMLTVENASLEGPTGGELAEGRYEQCYEMVGRLDWVQTKPVSETKSGEDRIEEMHVSICMRDEESNGACTRANVYLLKAIMRSDGAGWRVAGSSCTLHKSTR